MDELISKRAVIEAIEKARANVGHNLERSISKSIIEILDEVGEDVGKLPSAEPKRGKWSPADSLHHGAPFYFCSECGEKMLYTVMGKPRWNFCPNCGAKMEVTE